MSQRKSQAPTPMVSREELLQRVDGDMKLLQDLVDIFLEDLPQRGEQVSSGVGLVSDLKLARVPAALEPRRSEEFVQFGEGRVDGSLQVQPVIGPPPPLDDEMECARRTSPAAFMPAPAR